MATWRRRDDHDDDDGPGGFVKFDPGLLRSPDPDAAWDKKNKRTSFLGYKHHMSVDADSGLITSTRVTPGNEHDGVVMAAVLEDTAGAVVADKAYDLPRNHGLLERKRIEDRITRRQGGNGKRNAGRYVVERTNSIVKRWCGGGRARYWGIEKVSIQMLLASMAANLKRWSGMTTPAVVAVGCVDPAGGRSQGLKTVLESPGAPDIFTEAGHKLTKAEKEAQRRLSGSH